MELLTLYIEVAPGEDPGEALSAAIGEVAKRGFMILSFSMAIDGGKMHILALFAKTQGIQIPKKLIQ